MTWLIRPEGVDEYRRMMAKAAADDATFAAFRRLPGVSDVIEGVPDCVGQGYHAKLLDKLGLQILSLEWPRITRNDEQGSPKLLDFPAGRASSTTMRYAWNVVDMRERGVLLDGADVVEVGGGYGGLCRMVHAYHKPRSYTIVDLPEALALAKRYLSCYGVEPRLVSCREYGEEPIDTFVSNYALSELTRDEQQAYVSKLMSRATHGYVTCNSQVKNMGRQIHFDDLPAILLRGSEHVASNEDVRRSECQVLTWKPRPVVAERNDW